MKKIFTLACVAALFAACSNETTEDVMAPAKVTRSMITPTDTNQTAYECNQRDGECKYFLDLVSQQTNFTSENNYAHYHCTVAGCEMYNDYFLSLDEAQAHAFGPQGHHGGVASYE